MKKDEIKIIAALVAILIPPLGVGIKHGIGAQLVINILLTLLGFLPGLIHAIYVILKD
jgi:uncharacterized membrane protein YqaE (UPF0057 family)